MSRHLPTLHRRRTALLGIVVLVLVVAVLALSPDRPPRPSSRTAASAAQSALSACELLQQLTEQAAANEPGEDAVTTARQAREAAESASRQDAKWVQLSSAMQAIEESLQRDDPALAARGLRVSRAACATARQTAAPPSGAPEASSR